MDQLKIDIIGRGKVASHLFTAFSEKADTAVVNPHTLEGLRIDADFILISVTDSAIGEIIENLPAVKGIVAHTSGSTSIDLFKKKDSIRNYGVCYPLQTFTKGKRLDYSAIPFYIEGSDAEVERRLMKLASMISDNARQADSLKRRKLHVAAVFACNFTNHLWALSDKFLSDAGLDFKDLLPLIQETFEKVKYIPPREAQTGPAVRDDQATIKSHIDELDNLPDYKAIYLLLSDSIANMNRPENPSDDSHFKCQIPDLNKN